MSRNAIGLTTNVKKLKTCREIMTLGSNQQRNRIVEGKINQLKQYIMELFHNVVFMVPS